MRLAFDKPTVIIKDDKTDYTFDTGGIEHIPYPRDLRFSKIVAFKRQLADKVAGTYRASRDPNHSTFLKNFGKFKVAHLTEESVPAEQFVIEALKDLQAQVAGLRAETSVGRRRSSTTEAFLDALMKSKAEISNANDAELTDLDKRVAYLNRGEELRSIANGLENPDSKNALLNVASSYDRLANVILKRN